MTPEQFRQILKDRRSPADHMVSALDDSTKTLLVGTVDSGSLIPMSVHLYQHGGRLHRVVYEGDPGRELRYSHIVQDAFDVAMLADQCMYSPELCDPEFAALFNEIGYSLEFYAYRPIGRSTIERHEGILAFADDVSLDGPCPASHRRP